MLALVMRSKKFNRGAWALQRERFRIAQSEPLPDNNLTPIQDVVPAFLKSLGLDQQWREQAVVEKWADIVGPQIAAQTRPAQLQRGVLTVFVTHPTWLSELERFHKETILRRLQKQCPSAQVRALRFQISSDTQRGGSKGNG
jgi:predicted nucleic acid-binding Zn ribbon protein